MKYEDIHVDLSIGYLYTSFFCDTTHLNSKLMQEIESYQTNKNKQKKSQFTSA